MTHRTGNQPPLTLVTNPDSDHAPMRTGRRPSVGKIVGVTAAAALVAGYAHARLDSPDPTPPKPPEHSISYLNSDPMKTGVKVKEGDSGSVIAERANGGRLYGQALLDVGKFVENEGSSVIPGVNGEPATHILYAGDAVHPSDIVKVPILSDQQIADVNSGKIQ